MLVLGDLDGDKVGIVLAGDPVGARVGAPVGNRDGAAVGLQLPQRAGQDWFRSPTVLH